MIKIGDTFSRYNDGSKVAYDTLTVKDIKAKSFVVESVSGCLYTKRITDRNFIDIPVMKGSKYTNRYYKD